MAALWAVLSRLEDPKNAGLTLLQKLKLYNGKTLPGFTSDNVVELRERGQERGDARHLAALRAGQDLKCAGRQPESKTASIRSWSSTSWRTGSSTTR
jgi:hypothetical protein